MIDLFDNFGRYFANSIVQGAMSFMRAIYDRAKERSMQQLYEDLWITEPEHPLPKELPELTMHGYLLVRERGNILFCRSENPDDAARIRELGGVVRHYLTHWHEAGPGLARVKRMFGSKLVTHRLAEEIVAKSCPVDVTFDRQELHLGDIEVVPTPGHTAGSSSFVYRSPHGRTYLFVGDTVYPNRGAWEAVVFQDGNEADLRTSLETLRTLRPDVVLCGAAVASTPFKAVSNDEWHAIVDQATRGLCHWSGDGRAQGRSASPASR